MLIHSEHRERNPRGEAALSPGGAARTLAGDKICARAQRVGKSPVPQAADRPYHAL